MIVGKSNFICFRLRRCGYGTKEWFNLVKESKNYRLSIKKNIIGMIGEKIGLNIINNLTTDKYTIGNYHPNPDLVSDNGLKIEIKTTMNKYKFYNNIFWWHYSKKEVPSDYYTNLKSYPVMKLLIDENFNLVDYEFVILVNGRYINWDIPNKK